MSYHYDATVTVQVKDHDGTNGSITRRIKREGFSSDEGIASHLLIAEILTSIKASDIAPGSDKAQAQLDAFDGGEPG